MDMTAEEIKALSIKLKEAQKAEEANKRKAAYRIELKEVFGSRELYYIQASNRFYEYLPKRGTWESFSVESMKTRYAILRKAEAFELFTDELLKNKMFNNIVSTFKDIGDDLLNLMRRDHWMTPKKGQHSKWFDYLIQSLGGNKQENMDHIERVLGWKYLHPEEYQLPCMVIYGQGGVGKNELLTVLSKVYGGSQVTTVNFNNIGGAFNSVLAGKTVVFIDEMADDKADMNIMKQTVGNEMLQINEKFIKPYDCYNTALYMCGTNSPTGAIRLANDSSDRRWSIMKVERNLIDWIAKGEGCTYDQAIAVWKAEGQPTINDPEQIAVWLNHILTKWKSAGQPVELHGEDFRELVQIQKSVQDLVCDEILLDPAFTHITLQMLYGVYKETVIEDNPRGYVLGKQHFTQAVLKYIKDNNMGILYEKATIRKEGRMTSSYVFKLNDGKTILNDNNNRYVTRQYRDLGSNIREVIGSKPTAIG